MPTLNKIEVATNHFTAEEAYLMVEWVRGSYWGGWQSGRQAACAIYASQVLTAYIDGGLVGFVRFISDSNSNSMITDVYVDEPHRGKGVGRALMECAINHPSLKSTICILNTRFATIPFYGKFGFRVLVGTVMKRDPA